MYLYPPSVFTHCLRHVSPFLLDSQMQLTLNLQVTIEKRDFSCVGRFTHAVFCLHYLLPYVGNIGTIGTNDINNGTIAKTLNGICLHSLVSIRKPD